MIDRELAIRAELVERDAYASLTLAAPARVSAALGLHVVAGGGAVGGFAAAADVLALNRIVGFGVTLGASEEQLARMVRYARDAGVRRLFVHRAPIVTPPEVDAWIASHGGRPYNRWVRLWRETSHVPSVQTDLRIADVGPDDAATFGAVVAEAFGMPPAIGPWLAAVPGAPAWRAVAAYDGDRLVAGACLYVGRGTAWLGMASTAASHRGRGAQSALIARRIELAGAHGCGHVVVETAEETAERQVVPSYRNMLRLGFTEAYRRPNHLVELTP